MSATSGSGAYNRRSPFLYLPKPNVLYAMNFFSISALTRKSLIAGLELYLERKESFITNSIASFLTVSTPAGPRAIASSIAFNSVVSPFVRNHWTKSEFATSAGGGGGAIGAGGSGRDD